MFLIKYLSRRKILLSAKHRLFQNMVDAWFWLWVCEGFQVVLASNRWSMGRSIKSVWSTLLRAFFGEKRFVKGRGGAGGDGRGEGWYLIFIQKKKKIIHHIISYPVKYTLFMANVLNLIIFSPSFMLIRLSGVDRRFLGWGGDPKTLLFTTTPHMVMWGQRDCWQQKRQNKEVGILSVVFGIFVLWGSS